MELGALRRADHAHYGVGHEVAVLFLIDTRDDREPDPGPGSLIRWDIAGVLLLALAFLITAAAAPPVVAALMCVGGLGFVALIPRL